MGYLMQIGLQMETQTLTQKGWLMVMQIRFLTQTLTVKLMPMLTLKRFRSQMLIQKQTGIQTLIQKLKRSHFLRQILRLTQKLRRFCFPRLTQK